MAKATQTSETGWAMLLQDPQTQLEKRSARHERQPRETVLLTEAARRALHRKLSDLRDQKRREIPARLRIAREFGDMANSDEYFAIREEEAVLDARIARLEDVLARATVVEPANGHELVVVGSEVVVADLDTGEEREYVLDSAHGALGSTHVSPRSPVGHALLGRRAGERVRVQLPSGRVRALELRQIKPPRGT